MQKALDQSRTQGQTPSAGQMQGEFSWGCYLGQPSLPISLTPMACTPDLGQFLQCLAVYFSTIQAVDPTVGEGSGPGRTRSPNCVQTFSPTRAAPWSLGVRAQECLGCDRQKLRGHCRVERGDVLQSQEASYQHLNGVSRYWAKAGWKSWATKQKRDATHKPSISFSLVPALWSPEGSPSESKKAWRQVCVALASE